MTAPAGSTDRSCRYERKSGVEIWIVAHGPSPSVSDSDKPLQRGPTSSSYWEISQRYPATPGTMRPLPPQHCGSCDNAILPAPE